LSFERERAILVALLEAIDDRDRAATLGDDEAVLAVARRHRLTPLLSVRCRGALPAQLEEASRRDHVVTSARNLAFAAVAEECVAALAATGVEAALLKGLAYERTLYQQPGARPTGDVDLLVRDGDRRAAFGVLDRLGFEPRAAAPGFDEADYHEVAWRRQHVEIDLHMALAPYVRCSIDYGVVWREMREVALGAARPRVLAPTHAAVFHALHMAIDHFDVPALYLVDLARLLPAASDIERARETARAWRCHRPLETALALTAAFQPRWPGPSPSEAPARAREVIAGFGGLAPLPRRAQLRRKYAHFDSIPDAVRYTLVQGRRHVREALARRFQRRSARDRLGFEPPSRTG
jgi:hypothetical protein